MCGCSLRTKTLLLLWIGAISSQVFTGIGIICFPRNGVQKNAQFLDILMDVRIQIGAIITVIHAMGIYGVKKKKPPLLLPYLGFQLLLMVIFMLILCLSCLSILQIESSKPQLGHEDTLKKVFEIILAGMVTYIMIAVGTASLILEVLTCYCFILVWSFYKQLREEIRRRTSFELN